MLGVITHCNRPFNHYDRRILMQSVAKDLFRVHSAWRSTPAPSRRPQTTRATARPPLARTSLHKSRAHSCSRWQVMG